MEYDSQNRKDIIEPFNIIWSNLNKCDFAGKRPSSELEEKIFFSFPVLSDELKILKPDFVVFFSGPYFDRHIKRTFQDGVFSNVSNFSQNVLCRVEHSNLPYHSYRTYHPKYLRISGLEQKVIETLRRLGHNQLLEINECHGTLFWRVSRVNRHTELV